jgi:hypothetical protein
MDKFYPYFFVSDAGGLGALNPKIKNGDNALLRAIVIKRAEIELKEWGRCRRFLFWGLYP